MDLSLGGIGGGEIRFYTPGSRRGVKPSTLITSREFVIRVSGTAVPESGMTISVNGEAYTTSSVAVVVGDKVRADVTSAGVYYPASGSTVSKTLTIGSTVLTFTVTTMMEPVASGDYYFQDGTVFAFQDGSQYDFN